MDKYEALVAALARQDEDLAHARNDVLRMQRDYAGKSAAAEQREAQLTEDLRTATTEYEVAHTLGMVAFNRLMDIKYGARHVPPSLVQAEIDSICTETRNVVMRAAADKASAQKSAAHVLDVLRAMPGVESVDMHVIGMDAHTGDHPDCLSCMLIAALGKG